MPFSRTQPIVSQAIEKSLVRNIPDSFCFSNHWPNSWTQMKARGYRTPCLIYIGQVVRERISKSKIENMYNKRCDWGPTRRRCLAQAKQVDNPWQENKVMKVSSLCLGPVLSNLYSTGEGFDVQNIAVKAEVPDLKTWLSGQHSSPWRTLPSPPSDVAAAFLWTLPFAPLHCLSSLVIRAWVLQLDRLETSLDRLNSCSAFNLVMKHCKFYKHEEWLKYQTYSRSLLATGKIVYLKHQQWPGLGNGLNHNHLCGTITW